MNEVKENLFPVPFFSIHRRDNKINSSRFDNLLSKNLSIEEVIFSCLIAVGLMVIFFTEFLFLDYYIITQVYKLSHLMRKGFIL